MYKPLKKKYNNQIKSNQIYFNETGTKNKEQFVEALALLLLALEWNKIVLNFIENLARLDNSKNDILQISVTR